MKAATYRMTLNHFYVLVSVLVLLVLYAVTITVLYVVQSAELSGRVVKETDNGRLVATVVS